jgi:MerR family redox-sensitive transcriptional activator SoxR
MNEAADDGKMTIGQVAALAGVRASAIRYYEAVGVLPAPERTGGQRRYGADVLRRLAIIDVTQRAGFTLEEIRELLTDPHGDQPAYERVRALAGQKLLEVQSLIDRAQAVKRWLEVASACECSTLDICGLFDDRGLPLPERALEPSGAIRVIAVPAPR